MNGATNNYSGPSATNITGDRQKSPARIETVFRPLFSSAGKFQISSDYTRKVDRTTDITGRLPNAVYTLPPRLVHAIIGRAELSAATREALVAECKKFYLASREYEESKVVPGIGSAEDNVTGPRLIRLPPVLEVWHYEGGWFANTTRGLYAWGWNYDGRLGVGDDNESVQPRRVLINGDVLNVSMLPIVSFFRTDSGWFGCGSNRFGQHGLGHTDEVTTPAPIPGSEGVTRWGGGYGNTFGFSDDGLLACGKNYYGQCGVGSTERLIATLTPVALPDDVKGRVDRVVCNGCSSFFIAGRRCFAAGSNWSGQLGLGSDEAAISTPTELPVPVDVVINDDDVTVIRSGDALLACGDNEYLQISANNTPQFTTLTPLDLPGHVVKVIVNWKRIFIQLTDGAWVGQGKYHSKYFILVAQADLLDGPDEDPLLPGWTPVNDDYAEKLSRAQEAADDVMFLTESIANK